MSTKKLPLITDDFAYTPPVGPHGPTADSFSRNADNVAFNAAGAFSKTERFPWGDAILELMVWTTDFYDQTGFAWPKHLPQERGKWWYYGPQGEKRPMDPAVLLAQSAELPEPEDAGLDATIVERSLAGEPYTSEYIRDLRAAIFSDDKTQILDDDDRTVAEALNWSVDGGGDWFANNLLDPLQRQPTSALLGEHGLMTLREIDELRSPKVAHLGRVFFVSCYGSSSAGMGTNGLPQDIDAAWNQARDRAYAAYRADVTAVEALYGTITGNGLPNWDDAAATQTVERLPAELLLVNTRELLLPINFTDGPFQMRDQLLERDVCKCATSFYSDEYPNITPIGGSFRVTEATWTVHVSTSLTVLVIPAKPFLPPSQTHAQLSAIKALLHALPRTINPETHWHYQQEVAKRLVATIDSVVPHVASYSGNNTPVLPEPIEIATGFAVNVGDALKAACTGGGTVRATLTASLAVPDHGLSEAVSASAVLADKCEHADPDSGRRLGDAYFWIAVRPSSHGFYSSNPLPDVKPRGFTAGKGPGLDPGNKFEDEWFNHGTWQRAPGSRILLTRRPRVALLPSAGNLFQEIVMAQDDALRVVNRNMNALITGGRTVRFAEPVDATLDPPGGA